MKCVICKQPIIQNNITGKVYGHNPDPVRKSGECCQVCHDTIVLPRRLTLAGIDINKDILEAIVNKSKLFTDTNFLEEFLKKTKDI